MKNLVDLLFSFNGRICRKSWWLGFVIVLVASIGGSLVLDPNAFNLDPDVPLQPTLPDTIWQLALLIPGTAITVKRFNDRDWPFWLGYAYGVFGAVMTLSIYRGFLGGPELSMAEMAALLLSLAVMLFAIIDNGFMVGTKGENRYGPDPLSAHGQPA